MKKILTKEQELFLINNYMSMTYPEMCELELFIGINQKQLRNRARNMGLKKTREFDEDFFDNINSIENAYFLGLMYADGWNTKNNEIGISLNYEDKYILEIFNNLIGGVHNLKERKRNTQFNGYSYVSHTFDLRIYSKHMSESLISNGVGYNKTNSNVYPKVEKNLFWHFLRGFMDGDGCIYDNKTKTYPLIHFTNSNKKFLEYLMDEINQITGISGKIYKEKDKKYRLMYFTKGETAKLLEEIYKNSNELKLNRKYFKYCNYGSPMKETIG